MKTREEMIHSFASYVKRNNLSVSELLIIMECIAKELYARDVIENEEKMILMEEIKRINNG